MECVNIEVADFPLRIFKGVILADVMTDLPLKGSYIMNEHKADNNISNSNTTTLHNDWTNLTFKNKIELISQRGLFGVIRNIYHMLCILTNCYKVMQVFMVTGFLNSHSFTEP